MFSRSESSNSDDCLSNLSSNTIVVKGKPPGSLVEYPIYQHPITDKKVFQPTQWSLDNFEIGPKLGQGGYGKAYLALEKSSGYGVVLKQLSKSKILEQHMASNFKQELEIHSQLQHPGVVRMYGFFADRENIYFILEYAPGGNLYDYLASQEPGQLRKLSQKEAATIIKQLLQVIQYMHSNAVIHRDIKLENLLRFENGAVKISDFGWSSKLTSDVRTRTTNCGTTEYMAPEIISSVAYNQKVDIWAIGVLAYEICQGGSPFKSSQMYQTYAKVKIGKYTVPEYFSQELRNFVGIALQLDPKKRPTAEVLLEHPWIVKNAEVIEETLPSQRKVRYHGNKSQEF